MNRLSPRQVAIVASLGNAIESFDFLVYSFIAATVFGVLYFPSERPWLSTMAAVGTLATAYLVRPLGALLFGWVGDRFGRRPALIGSLALMGVVTLGVGLLPTYAAIGVAAPLVLIVLRLLQGVAIGGEVAGAIVVTVEHAPPARRVFYGAFSQVGALAGFLLVGLSLFIVDLLVDEERFLAWGWRIPFLISAALVVVGIVLRARLAETPEFLSALDVIARERRESARLRRIWRQSRSAIGVGVLLWLTPYTYAHAFLVSLPAYVSSFAPGYSVATIYLGLVLASALGLLLVLVAGYHGHRLDQARLAIGAGVWTVLWAAPAYWLIERGTAAALWLSMAAGVCGTGVLMGVIATLSADLFPVEIRYRGVAVTTTLGVVIAGAFLMVPALALVGTTNGSAVPLIVVLMLAGVATICGGTLARHRTTHAARPAPHAG